MSDVPAIQIVDWDLHYENNRTRELKKMGWVPMPNRHDGDGYTELLNHPNGAAHFGAWCALVEVASRCDVRGTLLRDGGKPHNPGSLARMTRIPEAVWVEVLPRLLSIGWISGYTIPQEGAGLPQGGAALGPQEGALNGMEWNGREGKGKKEEAPPQDEADLPPFDELPKKPADAPAPAVPVLSGPDYRKQLQERASTAKHAGDVASMLLYGLELLHSGPFASYPKEWTSAKKLAKSLTTMSRGKGDLCTVVRDLLRVYQHKRRTSRETYWKEAPLTPSGLLCRLEQLVSFAGKQRENAKLDELSAKAMRSNV